MLLDDKEQIVLKKSAELWNAILELDEVHPNDVNEHRLDIHNIQNRIMSRPVQREIKSREVADVEG